MRGCAGSTQCGPGIATSEVSTPKKPRLEEVGDHKGHTANPGEGGAGGTQVSPLLPGRLASVILFTARFFSSPTSCPSPASLPSCPHTSTARREEGRGGLQRVPAALAQEGPCNIHTHPQGPASRAVAAVVGTPQVRAW